MTEKPDPVVCWARGSEPQTASQAGAMVAPEGIVKLSRVFCGCGDPEEAWGWVRDYLAECNTVSRWSREQWAGEPPREVAERSLPLSSGPDWIARYLVDHLCLTEHGSSLYSAWATESGEEVLAFLNEHGADWFDKEWWVDEGGCTISNVGPGG